MASISDLIKLFPDDSITKDDTLWQLLFHTLDMVDGALADLGRMGNAHRMRAAEELTKSISDVVRRLEATEREKAAAFRHRMVVREAEGVSRRWGYREIYLEVRALRRSTRSRAAPSARTPP